MNTTTKTASTDDVLSSHGLLDALKRPAPRQGDLVVREGSSGYWVGITSNGVVWICWKLNDAVLRQVIAAFNSVCECCS